MLPLIGYSFEGINKNLEQGTSTTLRAALDPSLNGMFCLPSSQTRIEQHLTSGTEFSGAYLSDCQVSETPEYAHNPKLADKLWTLSEEIVGEKFEI